MTFVRLNQQSYIHKTLLLVNYLAKAQESQARPEYWEQQLQSPFCVQLVHALLLLLPTDIAIIYLPCECKFLTK